MVDLVKAATLVVNDFFTQFKLLAPGLEDTKLSGDITFVRFGPIDGDFVRVVVQQCVHAESSIDVESKLKPAFEVSFLDGFAGDVMLDDLNIYAVVDAQTLSIASRYYDEYRQERFDLLVARSGCLASDE